MTRSAGFSLGLGHTLRRPFPLDQRFNLVVVLRQELNRVVFIVPLVNPPLNIITERTHGIDGNSTPEARFFRVADRGPDRFGSLPDCGMRPPVYRALQPLGSVAPIPTQVRQVIQNFFNTEILNQRLNSLAKLGRARRGQTPTGYVVHHPSLKGCGKRSIQGAPPRPRNGTGSDPATHILPRRAA